MSGSALEDLIAASGIASLQEHPSAVDLERVLRRLAELLKNADLLRREAVRDEAVRALRLKAVHSPGKLVDASLGQSNASPAGSNLQGTGYAFTARDPWPELVDGAELLDEIANAFRRYLVLPAGAPEALALWTVHTYFVGLLYLSPYLFVTSPLPECGKSRLLQILLCLVHRALAASNISAASLFRLVEKHEPTLLIDEGDASVKGNEDLRGILNAGHTRRLAKVWRCEGETREPRQFSVFGPKAIAAIGHLPNTIEGRSVIIPMRRRKKSERVERFREDRLSGELEPLARRAARWSEDNAEAFRNSDPEISEHLGDRSQDNWRPLIAIADMAGGEWPERARMAPHRLSCVSGEAETSVGVQLLADIRDLFIARGTDRFSSEEIVNHLTGMEDRPWPAWKRGEWPMTKHNLARLLRPFEVAPKTIRLGDSTPKGYYLEDFSDAFERYLPSEPQQRQQASNGAEPSVSSDRNEGSVVAGRENDKSPHPACRVAYVADGGGEEESIGSLPALNPPIFPCHACRGTRFWRSPEATQCSTCHPPAHDCLVREWVDVATKPPSV